METGAQALCLNVVIPELHLVRVLRLRNRGRNQERSQGRSQERGRNQTKVKQKLNLVVEFSFID